MKKYCLFVALFILWNNINAQTCVTKTAATETNEAVAGSTTAWTTLGNAATSNNVRDLTSNLSTSGNYTDRLKLTNFSFAVPVNSSIQGITVSVERSVGANVNFTDREIMIVKGGVTQTGDNRATTAIWPTTDATVTYGGSADLWSNTWLPVDINSVDFGVAISAIRTQASGAPTNVRIDSVSITVCYLTLTPLGIKEFTVTKTSSTSTSINWVTTNEQHVKNILVQKSVNGIDYSLLKSVAPKGNNGNLDNYYQVTDNSLLNGTNYYRLKIVDENNTFKYSDVKTLTTNNNTKAIINYANQQIQIGITNAAGNYNLQVVDVTGRILFAKTIVIKSNSELISLPLTVASNQLIMVSLKGANLSIQKKCFTGN